MNLKSSQFQFLKNLVSKKWVILAPRRAKRPHASEAFAATAHADNDSVKSCPFCPGNEQTQEKEVYRIGGQVGDQRWQVRVIPNKFPFAPIHEVIINSPDHQMNFDRLPLEQIERVLQVYRHQYNEYHHKGQVYIFHNHGEKAGESITHPHSQLTVIPEKVYLDIPRLSSVIPDSRRSPRRASALGVIRNPKGVKPLPLLTEEFHPLDPLETSHFRLICPETSQWPDEVWVAPKRCGRLFGEITDEETSDLAFVLSSLVKIFSVRHGEEFPYNFYIYPGEDWYLRLIPREKRLGGFEVGTGVIVNTQDPKETMAFLKEHFHTPDFAKILSKHKAEYYRAA